VARLHLDSADEAAEASEGARRAPLEPSGGTGV